VLAVLLAATLSQAAISGEQPRAAGFALCSSRIAAAAVEEFSARAGRFTIAIKLTPEASRKLRSETERALGMEFPIVWDGVVLQHARLAAPVGSGLLAIGEWQSRKAAEGLLALIMDPSLDVACELH
jgi:hypothetical protein